MSSEIAIRARHVSKCFQTYERPKDRLIQGLYLLAARLAPPWSERLRQRAAARAKQYWALHDISFELKKGETLGIIGRNGSGKSTLLQILCGTLNPTQGEIEVHGRVAALLELGSGFNTEYTGRENVYLNGQLLGLSKKEIDQRLESIIAFADIGDFIDQPVKIYSSGMFVRLAFAVIAHVDADILVIDEALAVGDAFFTQKCMRFLRSFMEKGTILFVSHDSGAVKNLCKHALWLEKGHMQQIGSAKDVTESYLQAYYESMRGTNASTRMRAAVAPKPIADKDRKDSRLDWIKRSNLRNDIQIFEFDPNAKDFGTKESEITSVEFLDEAGAPLAWIVGGEAVSLRIQTFAHHDIDSPIVGFYIKDRLGQVLFGDNTYLTYCEEPLYAGAGTTLTAEFCFIMPILPKGEYSVCAAIASGTPEAHRQLQWIHDAMILKSETSHIATGLVGVPMQKIEITTSIHYSANETEEASAK
ncbi:MAG: ABC transporter ATP-binding protein [Burkholderiales bacterium]|nr:ABC transporter ATP-binding protein [Burkholderiales bacterium]